MSDTVRRRLTLLVRLVVSAAMLGFLLTKIESRGAKVLVPDNGAYCQRIVRILGYLGRTAVVLPFAEDQPADPAAVLQGAERGHRRLARERVARALHEGCVVGLHRGLLQGTGLRRC